MYHDVSSIYRELGEDTSFLSTVDCFACSKRYCGYWYALSMMINIIVLHLLSMLAGVGQVTSALLYGLRNHVLIFFYLISMVTISLAFFFFFAIVLKPERLLCLLQYTSILTTPYLTELIG